MGCDVRVLYGTDDVTRFLAFCRGMLEEGGAP